jgi:hypothetical protein
MFVMCLKNLEPNCARLSVITIFPYAEAFIAEAIDSGSALPTSPAPRDPLAHLLNDSGVLADDAANRAMQNTALDDFNIRFNRRAWRAADEQKIV